jgi:transcriptional regulator with XRE-family HTH domain
MMEAVMDGQVETALLRMARESAGFTQAGLAKELGVNPSVVSRLESSDRADSKMAERYLAVLNTDLAREIIQFHTDRWKHSERPRFDHPQRSVLWQAEKVLKELETFENDVTFDPILQGPLNKVRSRLVSEVEFVRQTEHSIAFIGDIGVGKTTALSFVTNLLTTDGDNQKSVFPTGSGRTTVCEVAIKIAPAFGIAVDAMGEDEIRRLVADLVKGLMSGKTGLPSELDRVIRNMADVRRITVRPKAPNGKPSTVDQLKILIDKVGDADAVVSELIARMKLETRTDNQMILSSDTEGSMEWLASNISKINYGQHPKFSVPQRITVLLPLEVLRETPYLLSVVDTKGVEGTTQRSDLMRQIEDERTVIVLCAKFPDAPGGTALSIVREAVDTGSLALDAGRVCLLVLPRDDEALKIVDDTGSNPGSVEEGYAVRETQIDQQFATEGLPPIPTNFFQVGSDDPNQVWTWLTSRIENIRQAKIDRIQRHMAAARDLVINADAAKTQEARRGIVEALAKAAQRFSELPAIVRFPQQNLAAEAKKSHQSSIAASVNRRGDWINFPVAHILGQGVRMDANLRTNDVFVRIDEAIEGLKGVYAHLADIAGFLEGLQEEVEEWRAEFLSRSALAGRTLFAPHLASAQKLWGDCETRYGAGSGYRVDISDILLEHFETDVRAKETLRRVEQQIAGLWQNLVIDPLQNFAIFENEEG